MKNLILFFILALSFQSFSQQLEPTENLALVTVTITNFKMVPSAGDLVRFTSKKTGKVYSGTSGANGKFQILLPKEKFFVFVQGFQSDDTGAELVIPQVAGQIIFTYNIRYELPKVFTLDNVHFDTNKSTIRPESFETLGNLVDLMKRKKTMVIELSGHTDNVGDEKANQKLSENRAKSVKDYLVSKGISETRITAVGYGSTRPAASNETDEGRQKNRRTEVSITKE